MKLKTQNGAIPVLGSLFQPFPAKEDHMEKIIDAVLGVIEVVAITGAIGFGSAKGLQILHDHVRKETIEVLKRPTPSLSHFSSQLTAPVR